MREEERVRQKKGKERSLIYLIKKRRKYTHKFSIEMRERSQDRNFKKRKENTLFNSTQRNMGTRWQ